MERGAPEFPSRRKIVPAGDGGLGLALGSRRATGRVIGLTNGRYDLFHAGHVGMLQHAASFCDDLIVAVDSDALIRFRYGAGLPICPYEERAAVVAALDCVWRVVEIPMTETGDSCLPAILDLLRPSVYICRSEEAVPEIEAAYKAHAKIVRLPRHGRRSSTEIARAIVRWADGKSG